MNLERRQEIADFYTGNPTAKDAVAFLKDLFGIEGGSITYSNGKSGFCDYSGKGLRINIYLPEGEYSRSVTWNTVQREIRTLISEGRFLTPAPIQRTEQLSLFDLPASAPAKPQIAQPTIPEELPEKPSDSVPEGMEDFFAIDTEEVKRRLNDPAEQKHIDEMLKGAEAVYLESRRNFPPENYHYYDLQEVTGGQKTHYRLNVEAIRTLKKVESENRLADTSEQTVLSKYVGWGGIPQVFDKNNEKWSEEYQELKELLTPEEYEAARASTLTAFYTPPAVIQAVHTALKDFGFTGGNILEPACGTGRFFGFLSERAEKNSKLFGVELDNLTGRIAQQLYQKAHIQIRGFEKAAFPDNFFDIAVGNVPFGEFKVPDPRYAKHNFLIHDYFFAKTLDKVRPGGMIAFVTSKGTMDKANPAVRRYIAQRAELIGAIRLPNTMMKTEANTEVTADLIFLKKRERMVDIEPEWVNLTYLDGGIPVNTYFADHPDMMLGTMAFDDRMYGNAKETTLQPNPQLDWREELPVAVSELHGTYEEPVVDLEDDDHAVTIPADPNVKNFSYTIADDGCIYYRENSEMVLKEFTGTRDKRIRGMIGIRNAMREVIRVQSNDFPDQAIKETQSTLNRLYDTFTRKYGPIIGTGNRLAFNSDSDYPLLCSLENIDDDKSVTKAAIFTKRTIRPPQAVTHVDTAVEALPHSLNQKGCVDLSYIASLTGKPEDQIIRDLEGIIFKDPIDGAYQTSDEYLSGNVRAKLKIAQEIAEKDPQYQANVNALIKVQPEDLNASQIDIRLGSPLLESGDVKQFVTDLLNPPEYAKNFKVLYLPSEALWKINGISHSLMSSDITASKTFGTHRINGYELIELSLNQKTPTIRDRKADDTYEINSKETAAAREKQKIIEQKFEDWIFRDHDRRERLVRKYNDVYNNIRLRQYDGSYLTFPGMNPEITLRTHQRNAAARIISSGNTLLAHCVGAGKTYTMIAAAMEGKRLGLCNKSMFVVPGHLIDQWGADILRLYPGANVLLATKKDFERSKRQRLISRIATGDYDAVVIANTSFEKIPVSPERQERMIKQQVDSIVDAMEIAQSEGDEDWTIKQMERTKRSLEEQLESLSDQSKKDDLLTFEELGVDQIFIDEAQYYKNLFIATKMNNVAGISQSHALKSTDLLIKCEYVNELNHGQRGIVFATGTPVSNSMSELYVMMRYLENDKLKEMGFEHFDAWAAQYGRKVSSLELTPDGTKYRYRTRFAEFVNLPELMNLYSLVADIQTAEQLKLPVPKMKGGKPVIVVAKPSPDQQELVKDIIQCFERIHNAEVDPSEDNALKETSRGRFGALDMRILDPSYEDFSGSKVNLAVQNIHEIWKESESVQGTQMVFCDLSTPHYDGRFNVYDDMKSKLIQMGIPENQVAFIHDAHTEKQKEQLFADMRAGKVRILFGSTSRMGAGTNAQRKIVAIHHMDAPWRPGDLEQRNGRAFRQGNENDEVGEYRYVTEGTFDAFSWQILEQKQKFISQVSSGRCVERHAQDIDDTVLDYATVKMLSTKDPRIKEREELRVRVAELNALKAQFNSEKYMMEDELLKFGPQRVARNKQAIQNLERDIELRNKSSKKEFEIDLFGKNYDKRETAGEIILQKANAYRTDGEYLPIGMYRGFRLELTYSSFSRTHSIVLCGSARHVVTMGDSAVGCTTRLDNTLKEMDQKIVACRKEIEKSKQRMSELETQLKIPWDHEDELSEKTLRLDKLNIELSNEMGTDKEVVLDTEPIQQESETEVEENEMDLGM
ncbi:SNF2-related protein [Caproicibacter fermentans]|uniref:DEAD/DEAH box helicase family protein n=1 Tax=Caproicibacter fermentans TaxID=2576756 RepID=A0A7G8TD61_9FIRM|nr:SNF2-related protein [Caproicibacter fermentans]QNK41552.1 DEAD/DEAH box helicase family protein [Caproicibacter fermentans]